MTILAIFDWRGLTYQVFIALMLSISFAFFLALPAAFFQPHNIGIGKPFPRIERYRQRYRRQYYPGIQILLSSATDQQFINGIALLGSTVGNFHQMTLLHTDLILYLTYLCEVSFFLTSSWEKRPLEAFDPAYEPRTNNVLTVDNIPRYASVGQQILNYLRITGLVIYSALLTVFTVQKWGTCGVWEVNNPRKCYQMTISISINIIGGCATVYVITILAIWVEVIRILINRSPMVTRFVSAGKLRIYQALRSDFLYNVTQWCRNFQVRIKASIVYRAITTYVRLDILGMCYLMFLLLDLKISNLNILADAKENEWTVGQISPMILLLSVPTTIARAAWGYVILSIFKVYRYYR